MVHTGPALSVVVPVYREVETLPLLCDRFAAAAPSGLDYEILFIDDGNYDNEPYQALEAIKARPRVRVIHLSRNFGQHVAIAAGLKNASGDRILVMDADLQYDPAECLGLYDLAIREGRDLVLSSISRKGQGFFKAIAARAVYRVMTFLGTPISRDDLGSVFLVSRHLANGLARMFDRHRFTITMALWLTNNVAIHPVTLRSRRHGRSGYTFRKLAFHAVTGLTAFSTRPLYVALVFSLLFAIGAASGVFYLLWESFINHRAFFPGWASTILVILACSATILACLGILGIYVGRIFEATQGRPLYFIREDRGEQPALFEENPAREPKAKGAGQPTGSVTGIRSGFSG